MIYFLFSGVSPTNGECAENAVHTTKIGESRSPPSCINFLCKNCSRLLHTSYSAIAVDYTSSAFIPAYVGLVVLIFELEEER